MQDMKCYFADARRTLRRFACFFVIFAVFFCCAGPGMTVRAHADDAINAELDLLARAAAATAGESEFAVQVAVCAVFLNRCGGAGFPDTLPAVLADFLSGDPAACRAFAAAQPSGRNLRAAAAALRGADPARGAVFFAVSDAVPSEVRASGRIRFESGGYAFWQ